jgi:hypothetical protein
MSCKRSVVVFGGDDLPVTVTLPESADATAAELVKAINRMVPSIQAHVARDGGISITNNPPQPRGPYRVPFNVARAAKRAGIEEAEAEASGLHGWLPPWLYALMDLLGRYGAHPGRYRRKMAFIAAHQGTIIAAYRLGGHDAAREAYLALRQVPLG